MFSASMTCVDRPGRCSGLRQHAWAARILSISIPACVSALSGYSKQTVAVAGNRRRPILRRRMDSESVRNRNGEARIRSSTHAGRSTCVSSAMTSAPSMRGLPGAGCTLCPLNKNVKRCGHCDEPQTKRIGSGLAEEAMLCDALEFACCDACRDASLPRCGQLWEPEPIYGSRHGRFFGNGCECASAGRIINLDEYIELAFRIPES
jgi:hypothetical protein